MRSIFLSARVFRSNPFTLSKLTKAAIVKKTNLFPFLFFFIKIEFLVTRREKDKISFGNIPRWVSNKDVHVQEREAVSRWIRFKKSLKPRRLRGARVFGADKGCSALETPRIVLPHPHGDGIVGSSCRESLASAWSINLTD